MAYSVVNGWEALALVDTSKLALNMVEPEFSDLLHLQTTSSYHHPFHRSSGDLLVVTAATAVSHHRRVSDASVTLPSQVTAQASSSAPTESNPNSGAEVQLDQLLQYDGCYQQQPRHSNNNNNNCEDGNDTTESSEETAVAKLILIQQQLLENFRCTEETSATKS